VEDVPVTQKPNSIELEKGPFESKRVEEALREGEARFRDTVEISPSIKVEYDLNGIPAYVNPHGYKPEDSEEGFYVLQLATLEEALKERTSEVKIKTKRLEQINTAMKVLLKKREEDKKELEDNVVTNVRELIAPYFKKIKKTNLDDQQKALLSIIESNVNEIISPFIRRLSLKHLNLTPAEIRIASLIKHGKTTKEIAKILKVSPRTIDTHRKNLRKKVGLVHKKANLRSHLLSYYSG